MGCNWKVYVDNYLDGGYHVNTVHPGLAGVLDYAQYRLEDSVALTGPLPQREIAARLASANVFVLPCRTEPSGGMDNLPTVIMEAMASALPVVSTNVGGIPEMVRPSETGLLVAQNDAAAIAEAMTRLINDPELARSFGQSGRKRASELFSIEKNVAELRKIFSL